MHLQVPLRTLEKIGVLKRTNGVLLYKKAERIMVATLAVSDGIESNTLREKISGEALNLFLGVRDAVAGRDAVARAAGARLALEAVSLAAVIEVACRLGEVSEGNYLLIRGEIIKLAEAMSQVDAEEEAAVSRRLLDEGVPVEKVRRVSRVTPRPAPTPATPRPIPDGVREAEVTAFKGSVSEMMVALSDSIKDRENSVLDIVRKKGKVSIKEVLSEIPSVGEKTVQRTLSNLVAQGTLRKVGERRWSRYEIVAPAPVQ